MAKKSLLEKIFSGGESVEKPTRKRQKNVPRLKLIFFIVDRRNANTVSDVCTEENVRFHFTSLGKGTASSDVLNLLGIGSSEKAVIICLEQEVGVPLLMKEVRKKLKNYGPGAGIAFSVPLSAINDPILLIFKQSILKNEKITADDIKSEGENMADKYSHDLIISIINQGFSDELMNTAREAGATGGTIIHSRGTAHRGAVKVFGVSVQDEKELILILTARKNKETIMRSICENHGLNSKAQGIIFSVPVDNVTGLNAD
ncbi:P-II family nitrogen regulator [Treponema sp. R6D11]